MEYKLIINDIVLQDVDESFKWYEAQQPTSGEQFILELKEVLYLIKTAPQLFPEFKKNVRKAVSKKYPYNIYFMIESEDIVLLGILHQKRNPSLLRKRMRKP